MTGEPNDKVDPERLALRARPRPVTRINRKVLYAGSALVLALIAGAVLFALDPPQWNDRQPTELLQTGRSPTPDGLARLPSTYDGIPQLGPPNRGDLGRAITRAERDLGIAPEPRRPLPSYRPDPEEEFLRSERIRLARMAAQAQESDLFFTIRTRQANALATEPPGPADGRRATTAGGSSETASAPDAAMLAALDALTPSGPSLGPSAPDPGGQRGKQAFLDAGPDEAIYNPHTEQTPISPYQLMAGTIIPASLVTGLNSDLPGIVIAQVTENVFDTVNGQHLLIPQGTRLIGRYDSVVAFGQERALLVWQRLIRPDGSSIVIDNLPATDTEGYAGLADRVDIHTWQLLRGIALSTLLGVGTELSLGDSESDLVAAIRESTQENADRAGQRIVERNLDIPPTITVRPGWPLRVIVNRDIVLSPYQPARAGP
ncbi:MAG: TrbI/VirB10 family protein [Roseitalea sp.]|jgi:type IV secretion system protein VirB10|nr:TrbI/VirB10 family protein [Roseitalea sp.]MBO6721120.1 TrbI/VirB10 family protein [Roseitalea sp.]MBO6744178.1 TrbI/VirB10 family protein [Roseitalea sp.]